MKINDLIIRYPTLQRVDGICRLRTFVNSDIKIVALITDIDYKNTSASITNSIEQICEYLVKKGFVPPGSIFIEHYENGTFDFVKMNENNEPEWIPVEKNQNIKFLNCEALEFESSTLEDKRLLSDIEQLRVVIDPKIDFPFHRNIEFVQRSFEIEKNQITKDSIQKLINSKSSEVALQKQIKKTCRS